MKLDELINGNGHVNPIIKTIFPSSESTENQFDIHPSLLPEDLKRLHDKIRVEDQRSFRRTYAAIFEEKMSAGLFWIVPHKDGWRILTFTRQHFANHQEHKMLWKEFAARMVAKPFDKEPDDMFLTLYNAYPRGRLVDVPNEFNKWWIGFGEDYPPGWDETKLMSNLGVGPANSSFEYDGHWKANPTNRRIADTFLGIL